MILVVLYPTFVSNVNTQKIVPGSAVFSTPACLSGTVYADIEPIALTNISAYTNKRYQNFVIAPGSSGLIKFLVIMKKIGMPNNTTNVNITNVTNHINLYHESYKAVEENVTQINVSLTRYSNGTVISSEGTVLAPGQTSHVWINKGTVILFPNGTKMTLANNTYFAIPTGLPIGTTIVIGYKACYPGGCYSGGGPRPPEFLNISFDNYSHPGLNLSFNRTYELVSSSKGVYVNLTITVMNYAQSGTYMLGLYAGSRLCGYKNIYLTIGNSPYIKNATTPQPTSGNATTGIPSTPIRSGSTTTIPVSTTVPG